MLRHTWKTALLVGVSVWLIGQAPQFVSGDDKPAKKTDAAKEQTPPTAQDPASKAATAKDQSGKTAAGKKKSDRHGKEGVRPNRDRDAGHSWQDGPRAGRWGGPQPYQQHPGWGDGEGRGRGPIGPWARGPYPRDWDDPRTIGPHDSPWRGPHSYQRPGWGDSRGRGPAGPWAQGPYAGHWRSPWAQGPYAGHWRGPWASGPHNPRWNGPQCWRGPQHWRGPDQGQARMKKPSVDELFQKFDANKDGAISKEEFAAGLKKVHEQPHGKKPAQPGPGMGWHAGYAGFASPAGMRPPFTRPGEGSPIGRQAGRPPRPLAFFEQFDKNKDGKLTKDEVPAPLWVRIANADANKDDAVTKEELEAVHKKMQEQFRQKAQEWAAASKGPQAGPTHGRKPRGAGLLDQFDKNKDGKLTKDEVPAPLWERIANADANKDGTVTKEELEAVHKKAAESRGAKPAK